MEEEQRTVKRNNPRRFITPFAGLILLVILFLVFNTRLLDKEPEIATSTIGVEVESATETAHEFPVGTASETSESRLREEAEFPLVNPTGQTIEFWHVWYSEPAKSGMMALVDEFNANNEWGITVDALDQGNYRDVEDLIDAGTRSGDLPNLVVAYPFSLASWYSLDIITDLNQFVTHSYWGFSQDEIIDFIDKPFSAPTAADGSRFGLPISQSLEVLFYNRTWAQELGFDRPPTTPEEFKEQACAAAAANAADDNPDNDGTGGYVLYAGASQVSAWWFSYGGYHLSADGAWNFATPEMEAVAEFLKDLWDEGCAFPTESYPNPEFATRKALMVTSSSVGIPYQLGVFDDAGTSDEWAFMPFPGDAGLAVDSYLQTVGMVGSTPERELAAWLFMKWFTEPEQQARWIEASAYYPSRAGTVPLLDAYAAENPQWASGLELVPLGKVEPSIASWASVRRLLQDAFSEIIQGTPDMIPGILADLDEAAAEAMAEME